MNGIHIVVDYYPAAQEFLCVLHYQRQFQCSWRSLTNKNIYKLFLSPPYGDMEICSDNSGASTGGCVRTLDSDFFRLIYSDYSNFSIEVQTCNEVFCSNQTFSISTDSITRLNPVLNLRVDNTSSREAIVTWATDIWHGVCVFKVEYKMLGTEWVQVNASTVECSGYVGNTCKFELALPCPGAHYELRVYVRVKHATKDIYWSEPSTIYFFTTGHTRGKGYPCNVKFREPKPVPSAAAVVLHEVLELISDERELQFKLAKLISTLKQKKAQILAFLKTRA